MDFHGWLFDWSSAGASLMANHLWQATLFASLVFMATRFLRRGPARVRHALWLMALLKFVLPSDLFLLALHRAGVNFGLPSGAGDLPAIAVSRAIRILEPAPLMGGSVSAPPEMQAGHAEIFCALALIWLFGFVLMLALWFRKRLKLSPAHKASADDRGERVLRSLARVRARLGIKRRVTVALSSEAVEPGVWRVWRPVLALPSDLPDHLSDDELDAMLMHELVHVSRWDNLVSSFSMTVCCILWFHPMVWLIDRRLLSERECSCDERVLELGVSSRIYAASLLKVLRFCVGCRIAGVSTATGSNLQKRVELILDFRERGRGKTANRLLIGSFAASALAFTLATGLLVQSDVVAQSLKTPRARKAEPRQSAPEGGEAALAPQSERATPRPALAPSPSSGETRELMREAEKAPFTRARFENQSGAPLNITDAQVKVVPRDQAGAHELLIMPRLTLVNNTNRRIAAVYVRSRVEPISYAVTTSRVDIGPYESFVLQLDENDWSEVLPSGSARRLTFSVQRVVFEDKGAWGVSPREELEPALAPSALAPNVQPAIAPRGSTGALVTPVAPAAPAAPEREPEPRAGGAVEYVPAQFENPTGAPLVIYTAVTPVSLAPGGAGQTALPIVTLVNASDRRIAVVKLRFKADTDEHAVSAFRVSIEPGGYYSYRSDRVISGSARFMKVQVIGVEFEDGSVWGAMNSRINSRDEWIQVPLSIRKGDE